MLAICVVDFMILNINNNNISNDNSLKRIKNIQNKTQQLLNSYSIYDSIDKLKQIINILHLFINNSINNNIYFLPNFYDFILSKPSNNTVYFYKEEKSIFSKMYFTPLWIKTKYSLYISAKKMNKYIFKQITNNIQYNTKLKIIFKPDKICYNALEWILSGVTIEKKEDIVYIQSPIYITNNNTLIYKNFYYFKILSPSQILELINIDLQDY